MGQGTTSRLLLACASGHRPLPQPIALQPEQRNSIRWMSAFRAQTDSPDEASGLAQLALSDVEQRGVGAVTAQRKFETRAGAHLIESPGKSRERKEKMPAANLRA
jgi:hypothetical protein